jgi:hypothetical protein
MFVTAGSKIVQFRIQLSARTLDHKRVISSYELVSNRIIHWETGNKLI